MSKIKSYHDNDKWLRKLRKYEKLLECYSDSSTEENLLPGRSGQLASTQSPFFLAPTASPKSAINSQDTEDRKDGLGAVMLATMAPSIPPPPSWPLGIDLETKTSKEADPELLLALGDLEDENEFGQDLIEDLAQRWDPILRDGLKTEVRNGLFKKYLFPRNCPLMKPPIVNPEIAAMLKESSRNRDARICKKQHQLACALTILGRTMSDILTKSVQSSEILRNLSDAGKLLADSHYLETETRRYLVSPMIDKKYIQSFKERKRDNYLYGEKLSEFIATSRGLQVTGRLIQPSVPGSVKLKNPESHIRQHRRGCRPLQSRSSGLRSPPYSHHTYGPASPRARHPPGEWPIPLPYTASQPSGSGSPQKAQSINTLVDSGQLNTFFDAWKNTPQNEAGLGDTRYPPTSGAL